MGDNFSDPRVIAGLPGASAIGHNRYATTGDAMLRNVQPLFADFEFGGLAIAHNGNLTNAMALRRALIRRGCLFQSTTDSEVFIHLVAISQYSTVVDRLIDALRQVVALLADRADRGGADGRDAAVRVHGDDGVVGRAVQDHRSWGFLVQEQRTRSLDQHRGHLAHSVYLRSLAVWHRRDVYLLDRARK